MSRQTYRRRTILCKNSFSASWANSSKLVRPSPPHHPLCLLQQDLPLWTLPISSLCCRIKFHRPNPLWQLLLRQPQQRVQTLFFSRSGTCSHNSSSNSERRRRLLRHRPMLSSCSLYKACRGTTTHKHSTSTSRPLHHCPPPQCRVISRISWANNKPSLTIVPAT